MRPTGCPPRPPPAGSTWLRAGPLDFRKMEGSLPNVAPSASQMEGAPYANPDLQLMGGRQSMTYSSDVAFSPAVKAVQARKGLRPVHARIEERGGWETRITPDLAAFIGAQTSVFFATAS